MDTENERGVYSFPPLFLILFFRVRETRLEMISVLFSFFSPCLLLFWYRPWAKEVLLWLEAMRSPPFRRHRPSSPLSRLKYWYFCRRLPARRPPPPPPSVRSEILLSLLRRRVSASVPGSSGFLPDCFLPPVYWHSVMGFWISPVFWAGQFGGLMSFPREEIEPEKKRREVMN